MRNITDHDYLGINPDVIIATVENDVPNLRCQIELFLWEMIYY